MYVLEEGLSLKKKKLEKHCPRLSWNVKLLIFRYFAAPYYKNTDGTAVMQLQQLDYKLLSKVIYLDFPYPLMNCKYINRKGFLPAPPGLYNF